MKTENNFWLRFLEVMSPNLDGETRDEEELLEFANELFKVMSSTRGRAELYGQCEFKELATVRTPFFRWSTWTTEEGELFTLLGVSSPRNSEVYCLMATSDFYWQNKEQKPKCIERLVSWLKGLWSSWNAAQSNFTDFFGYYYAYKTAIDEAKTRSEAYSTSKFVLGSAESIELATMSTLSANRAMAAENDIEIWLLNNVGEWAVNQYHNWDSTVFLDIVALV